MTELTINTNNDINSLPVIINRFLKKTRYVRVFLWKTTGKIPISIYSFYPHNIPMPIFLLCETSCPNKGLKTKLNSEIKKHGGKIAYISSTPQDEQKIHFCETVTEYKNIDSAITLEYFDLGKKFSEQDLQKVLSFGIIHLSGGNAFGFLDYINKRNFGKILKTHLNKNGLIIGVSAGSIVLTPNINVCNLPEVDENLVKLKNLTALNFVDFEFYPHFTSNQESLEEIKKYSVTTDNAIYVCTDENGIFVDNQKIEILNNILKIQRGAISY